VSPRPELKGAAKWKIAASGRNSLKTGMTNESTNIAIPDDDDDDDDNYFRDKDYGYDDDD
jgi:hypothetical protein